MGFTPKPKPDTGRGKILSTALLALALLASLVTFSPLAQADSSGNGNGNGGDEDSGASTYTYLCHATPPQNAKNGWNKISPDPNSFLKDGHDGHAADIIPPFDDYPGKNWDAAGIEVWENDCVQPTDSEKQSTFITVAWKLPDGYADNYNTRQPNQTWPEIWAGNGQAFVAKTTTPNNWDLDALDDDPAVTNVLNQCDALQVDVYRYTKQADIDAVEALWADSFLTKTDNTPEDSGLHPVTGLGEGWKFLWNDDPRCDEPEEPVVTLQFQKLVCEPDSVLPYTNDSASNLWPTDLTRRLTLGSTVPSIVGPVDTPPAGCHFEQGWEFFGASTQKALKDNTNSSGVVDSTKSGIELLGTTGSNGMLEVSSADLSDSLKAALFDGGLWVAEGSKTGRQFELLQCHTDAVNGDNLERIGITENDLNSTVNCVAWNSGIGVVGPDVWDLSVSKTWTFWTEDEPGTSVPSGTAEITLTIGTDDYVIVFDTEGKVVSINGNDDQKGNTEAQLQGEGTMPEYQWEETGYQVDGWTCEASEAIQPKAAFLDLVSVENDCTKNPEEPETPVSSTVPPTTVPPTPVPESTTTTEEVGGIDEEPTTTTEAPTTTAPEVKDTVVTPTTVAKQTLPRTGSNTGTVLSLAGVLMTVGAAFVLFGRRRFNSGN